MQEDKRLTKIINFLKEAERLKLVERIPYLSDKARRENDAEHSWYLALMLLALEDDLGIKCDLPRTYRMILVHDLVEIDTKDDWVPDTAGKAIKRQNELVSAKRVFGLLPADLAGKFMKLWQEYEAGETIEAKIAKGLDKISHTLQYSISKKVEWHREYATKEESRDYALPHVSQNPVLLEMFDTLLDELEETIEENLKKNEKRPVG
ncbi:MAG: HD domain-containing protein [Patescibacteria group bacterium]|jgi:putative hydrolase of HD superfamily